MNVHGRSHFIFLILYVFIGCSKNDKPLEPIAPPVTPPARMGEVIYDFPDNCGIEVRNIIKTSINDYFIVGTKPLIQNNGLGPCEYFPFIQRINNKGNVSFRIYPFTNIISRAESIVETDKAFFIQLFAFVQGSTEFLPNSLELVKMDKDGNILWSKRYDNTNEIYKISKLSDGNLMVMGAFETKSFLMKLDLEGNILFRKDYDQEKLYYGSFSEIIEEEQGFTFLAYRKQTIALTEKWIYPQICKTDKSGAILSRVEVDSLNESYWWIQQLQLLKKPDSGYFFMEIPAERHGLSGQGFGYVDKRILKVLNNKGAVLSSIDLDMACSIRLGYISDCVQTPEGELFILALLNISPAAPWISTIIKIDKNGSYIKHKSFSNFGDRFSIAMTLMDDNNIMVLNNVPRTNSFSVYKVNRNLEIQ